MEPKAVVAHVDELGASRVQQHGELDLLAVRHGQHCHALLQEQPRASETVGAIGASDGTPPAKCRCRCRGGAALTKSVPRRRTWRGLLGSTVLPLSMFTTPGMLHSSKGSEGWG